MKMLPRMHGITVRHIILRIKLLMKGTDITKFSPNEYVTRCMLAQIINNIDGKKDKRILELYLDVDENAWYARCGGTVL